MRAPMWIAVVVLLVCSLARDARAQPSEEARAAFERGKALFEEHKHVQALPELQRAAKLSDSPNARLYVGRCLKELGRKAEAYEELSIAMRESAKRAETDPKYANTRDAAAGQLAILDREVGKVVVVLTGDRPGVVAKIGDVVLAAADLGVPRAVEPGVVVGRAVIDGVVVTEKRVDVSAGATVTITLDTNVQVEEKIPTTGPIARPTRPDGTPPTTGGEIRIAGFVIGSLGVAGLAAFGVTGGLALDRLSTLEEECGAETPCPDDAAHNDLIAEGRTLQTAANVSLGIGAGLLAAGVFMVAFGGPREAPTSPVAIELTFTGMGLGASLKLR